MSSIVAVTADLAPSQRSPNIAPHIPLVQRQIAPTPNRRLKKIRLNLPKETVFFGVGDGRFPLTRSHFARTPIPPRLVPSQPPVLPPDVVSADIYPPDGLRVEIPDTINVSLPGRVSAWSLLVPSGFL